MTMKIGMLALLLPVGGCAAPPMRGWTALAPMGEAVEVTGIGVGTAGDFRLSTGARGRFGRESLSASDDPWRGRPLGGVARYGGARFTVAGPGVRGTLTGECRFDQGLYREVEGNRRSSVETSVTEMPLLYRCRFERNGQMVGRLMLGERPSRRVEVAERRIGEVEVDGRRLALVSEHDFDGRAVGGVAAPLGYRFEDGDRAVGAAELNGRARLLLPRDPAARETALAAGLALAFLWDPGAD